MPPALDDIPAPKAPKHNPPEVTVVIPVLNDSRRLALCLQALGRQTYPKEQTQIIVVDNGSAEDIPAVARRFPGVVCLHQAIPGAAAARNKGIAAARGSVIAFTDSDCIPALDWLQKGVHRLRSVGGDGLIGGRIDRFYRDGARPTSVELYDLMTSLQQRNYVENGHWAATANAFTSKDILENVGGFNESFPSAAGEDREWGERVFAKGYPVVYADDAVVAHPTVSTFKDLYARACRIQDGLRRLRRLKPAPWTPAEAAKEIVRNAGYAPAKLCARIMFREEPLKDFRQRARACLVAVCAYYMNSWINMRAAFGSEPGRNP